MKRELQRIVLAALIVWSVPIGVVWAQTPLGSAITYQGQLKNGGSPANGPVSMTFRLYNDPTASGPGNQVGPTLIFDGSSHSQVNVVNGMFTLPLDFGAGAFSGGRLWLEVTVGSDAIAPRQELTAAPYSRFSAAPWVTTGNNISYTAGNVGIGMASPTLALDARPDGILGSSVTIGNQHSLSNLGIKASVGYQPSGTSEFVGMRSLVGIGMNGCGNTGDIRFDTWECNTSLSREVMRITGRGNVGVGTSTPIANLDVIGNGALPHLRVAARDDDFTPYGAFFSLDSTATSGGKNWLIFATGASAGEGQGKLVIKNESDSVQAMAINAVGNVGIGTTTPGFPLTFADTNGDKISLFGQSGAIYGLGIQANLLQIHTDSAASDIAFGTGTSAAMSEIMRIKGTGKVGIGLNSPQARLDAVAVAGSATPGIHCKGDPGIFAEAESGPNRIGIHAVGSGLGQKAGLFDGNIQVNGAICATGTIGVCSDARFKEHIKPLPGAMDKVQQLRGVIFDWKRGEFPEHRFSEESQVGFIAQEVEKVLPQVVAKGTDGYLSVDYGRLTPVLVEAVKELKSENTELKARLERLESMLGDLGEGSRLAEGRDFDGCGRRKTN